MVKTLKTEDLKPSKKGLAERPSKESKGLAATKGAAEKTGKHKGKAAKEAAGKADKAAPVKRERKVFELPGQTKDTPPEVCFLPVAECRLDHPGFSEVPCTRSPVFYLHPVSYLQNALSTS